MEPIVNRDPGDENDYIEHGLVAVLRDCTICGAVVLAALDDKNPMCQHHIDNES